MWSDFPGTGIVSLYSDCPNTLFLHINRPGSYKFMCIKFEYTINRHQKLLYWGTCLHSNRAIWCIAHRTISCWNVCGPWKMGFYNEFPVLFREYHLNNLKIVGIISIVYQSIEIIWFNSMRPRVRDGKSCIMRCEALPVNSSRWSLVKHD